MSVLESDFRALNAKDDTVKTRAVTTILRDPFGRYLLQLRDKRSGIAWPGRWSLFGGGVEPGESLSGAASREVFEEIGVRLTEQELTPFARVTTEGRTRVTLFVLTSQQLIRPGDVRLGEGAGFAFLIPDQIAKLPLVPSVRMVLDHFFAEDDA